MTALDLNRIAALKAEGFALGVGHHDASEGEGCAMDLIAWQTTGEITDMPSCVHPVLSRLVHRINDAGHTTAEGRWRIVTDAGPLLVGTDKWEGVRAAWVVANAGMTVGGLIDALRTGANLAGADLTRANLAGANLTRADLAGANLTRADLAGANLTRANLAEAYLAGAYLAGANLARANLAGANLTRAYLAGAYLAGANLAGANLTGAYLAGADLAGANLAGANLAGANLTRANLAGANLTGANLTGANLAEAKGNQWTVLPAGWTVADYGLVVRSDP